jgi:hypothetical protein
MKAPMAGIPFWLYIATEDTVIGAVLTQVTDGKEHIITYLSRRLIDAKTGIHPLKNYACPSFMLAPNFDIIWYLVFLYSCMSSRCN